VWILPPSITSAYAQDTGESISVSPEQWAEACAQSLIARSKPSPPRTWLQRWKRDSWTRHLFGLISSPSRGKSFVDWWTSSVAATRASHFHPLENEPERTIRDTCGHGSQMELPFADLDSASSRTSKDTSRWDSPQSSATWKKWVTERRGAYSQRLKSAHLTNGSGSSSWPTAAVMDTTGGPYKTEFVGGVFRSYHNHTSEDAPKYGARLRDAVTYGQADPANHSTDGSRLELWQTPDVGSTAGGRSARGQSETHRASLERQTNHWATPRQTDAAGVDYQYDQGDHGKPRLMLPGQAKAWATPTARDNKSGRGNEDRQYKELTPMVERQQSGKLNPRWVETLMGVPIGWTMPSCTSPVTIEQTNSDCSETESCQPQQSELF